MHVPAESGHSEAEGVHCLPLGRSGAGTLGSVARLLMESSNYIAGLQPLVMSSVTSSFTQEKSHTCATPVAEVQQRALLCPEGVCPGHLSAAHRLLWSP